MNYRGDYLDEMKRTRTSDAEIERLFAGSPNVGADLEPLAGLLAALRTDAGDELTDDQVATYVAAAVTATGEALDAPAARTRRQRPPLLSTLRRRAATVTVAATVLLGGTSGLAAAADGAKPGDALYGIDRALETVGIGDGAEQERLSEAEALIDDGDFLLGLQHAAEALEDSESVGPETSQALMNAANRVRAAGAEPTAATRERVAGLVSYLAENPGGVDGALVAELATQIGGRPDHVSANSPGQDKDKKEPGPPENVPADPPGQDKDKKEPGPPENVPADPPGQDKDKKEPGPPDSLPNNKPC